MFLKQLFIFFSLSFISFNPSPSMESTPQSSSLIQSQIASNQDRAIAERRQNRVQISQTPSNRPIPDKRPAPPSRIPPNKVKPGGGLNPNQQACTNTNNETSLIALVPVENPVLTTKAHPSFLFYIPDSATAISHGEFAVFTADEKTRIYATEISLERVPGIIKISIPPSLQYALEAEKLYHWYFRVHCQGSSDSPVVLDVDGWIQRVPLTSTRQSQIKTASPEIWYDAISETAANLIVSPQSLAVRDNWMQLLQHINLEHLADDSVVYSYQESKN